MPRDRAYRDIPGTTVFDAHQARKAYHLNMFCMSLVNARNRERFLECGCGYLDEWLLSDEQKQAVLARDYNRMISLGGNIYFLGKIIGCDRKSYMWAAAQMSGMSKEDYWAMMLAGGRAPSWTPPLTTSSWRIPPNENCSRGPHAGSGPSCAAAARAPEICRFPQDDEPAALLA